VALGFDPVPHAAEDNGGEQAVAQGRPSQYGHLLVPGHRDEFPLDRALQQAVFDLQADVAGPAAQFGQGVGFRHDPGRRRTGLAGEARGGVGVLGSQHHFFPVTCDELANELFAGAVGVNVGSVDEVATRLPVGVVDFACLVLGRAPAPVFAESHRAEAKVGNAQAAAAEKLVVH
jgi:hypothetical protein